MNRYPLILLLMLGMCLPIMADWETDLDGNLFFRWAGTQYAHIEDYVTPRAGETLAQVEARYEQMLRDSVTSYGTQITNFAARTDVKINTYNNDAYTDLTSSVTTYVNGYNPSRATEFDINSVNTLISQYLSTAGTYCATATALINANANSHTQLESVKNTYAENAKEIVKYFMEDITTNHLFGLADYQEDFRMLGKYVNDRLTRSNTPRTGGVRHKFEPLDYVDKGLPDSTRDRIQVQIEHAGVRNQYVGKTTNYLLNKVNEAFGDSDLQNEVDWYANSWSGEMFVTESQLDVDKRVNELGYSYTISGRESLVNLTMNVNEYGNITGHSEGLKDAMLPASQQPDAIMDGIYNNRRYGYSDGDYNTVSVTVAGKKYQLYDHFYTSPLVLDLDGDGNLEASKGEWLPHKYDNAKVVEFDIDGDQFVELTEWVGTNDGILLVGYEKGKEINANYMFGEAGGYKNGYEKLSLFDANGDKQISGDELKTLSVWQDKNGNGKVDDGEVVAVSELGITSISLTHDQLVSSFVQKGETRKLWDWYPTYFRLKKTPN